MERNISLDLLKLIMAFMVVGLHAGFLADISAMGLFLTAQGIFRIAVPIFLLINGYYFFKALSSNHSGLWIKRVCILYIVWMSIYSFFWFSIPDYSLKGVAIFMLNIILGFHHLWYLSGIIVGAIILVLFHKLPSPMLFVISLISFFTGVLIQYSGVYHFFEGEFIDKVFNIEWSHRNAVFFSFPFLCLGYLINKHSFIDKINLKLALLGCFLGFILLLGESYVNYLNITEYRGFDNCLSLIIVCPMLFILVSKIKIKGRSKTLALYSSSVYFIHVLILWILKEITRLEGTSLTFLTILGSVLVSYFIIELNKKVKVLL